MKQCCKFVTLDGHRNVTSEILSLWARYEDQNTVVPIKSLGSHENNRQ